MPWLESLPFFGYRETLNQIISVTVWQLNADTTNSSYLASKTCDLLISRSVSVEQLSYCILMKQNITMVSSVSTHGKIGHTILSTSDQVRGGIGSSTCFLEGARHKAFCTPWQDSSPLKFFFNFYFCNAEVMRRLFLFFYFYFCNSGIFSKSEFIEMMEEHKHHGIVEQFLN